MNDPRRLLYVVNRGTFFVSHRLTLAIAARDAGYEVHVATPRDEGVQKILASGLTWHEIPLNPKGMSPLGEYRSFRALLTLYRKLAPDIIHHVTLKPVIYGGIAARFAKIDPVVSALTGMGWAFISSDFRARIIRTFAGTLLKYALGGARTRLILQNEDDAQMFRERHWIDENKIELIKGSGVDINIFAPSPEPEGDPVVLLPGRMLYDKGVGEFAAAAREVKKIRPEVRFLLAGGQDERNRACVEAEQLKRWQDEGLVEWLGECDDMPALYAKSNIVCLPSYREGLPRALIEAAACARAIVATDVPGCREIARDGENALLVPPKDADSLAKAIIKMLADPAMRRSFGAKGREIAVAKFTLPKVIKSTLQVYERTLSG